MTQRYKAVLAYDGGAYSGWQVQPGMRTIQSECQNAMGRITRESVHIHSSGRTDTGVHAHGQVAHFDLNRPWEPERLLVGLNAVLDADIRFTSIVPVNPDFHARFSAVRKEYRYMIWNDRFVPPHLRHYRLQYSRALDLEPMRVAAARLVGRHDFASFCSSRGGGDDNTVRNLLALDVLQDGREYTVVALGEGFLYKMVRSLTGFLIRVGTGVLEPKDADRLLHTRKRSAVVPCAKPHGLFLWRVDYPEDIN